MQLRTAIADTAAIVRLIKSKSRKGLSSDNSSFSSAARCTRASTGSSRVHSVTFGTQSVNDTSLLREVCWDSWTPREVFHIFRTTRSFDIRIQVLLCLCDFTNAISCRRTLRFCTDCDDFASKMAHQNIHSPACEFNALQLSCFIMFSQRACLFQGRPSSIRLLSNNSSLWLFDVTTDTMSVVFITPEIYVRVCDKSMFSHFSIYCSKWGLNDIQLLPLRISILVLNLRLRLYVAGESKLYSLCLQHSQCAFDILLVGSAKTKRAGTLDFIRVLIKKYILLYHISLSFSRAIWIAIGSLISQNILLYHISCAAYFLSSENAFSIFFEKYNIKCDDICWKLSALYFMW